VAGIKTRIGYHSMRATGITDYLKSDRTLEHAQTTAAHSSPRTIKLYDQRKDETALDEYEKVRNKFTGGRYIDCLGPGGRM